MAIQKTPSVFATILRTIEAQRKPLLLVGCFFVGFLGLAGVYKLWSAKKEREAQYDFSSLMTEYETISQDKNPDWEALLKKFEKNYEKHSGSPLLPYYLNYKVRILLHQDKREEALSLLNRVVTDIPGSPILSVYKMEQALIQMDSADDAIKNIGLKTLIHLAQDMNNEYRDSAQYYLGRYYWAMNDIDAARKVWQELVDQQHDEKLAPSPWIGYVQDKLNIIIV